MVCGFDVKTKRCNKTSKTGREMCKMGNQGRCVKATQKSPSPTHPQRY